MTKEQAINIAVDWWAKKLSARAPHSNGDSGLSSVFACLLADSGMENTSKEQIDIFKRELRSKIEADIGNRWREIYLGCDYDPTVNLRDAVEAAGISKFNIPFKTDMYIKWDEWYGESFWVLRILKFPVLK